MAVSIDFAWDWLGATRGLVGWATYLSERREEKGTRIGSLVPPEPRKVRVAVEEGTWFLRVVPVFSDGSEFPEWRSCPGREVFATGREQTPDAPSLPAAAFIDPGASVRVIVSPVDMETVPGLVEVVSMPADVTIDHAAQGKLIGTFPVHRLDLIDKDPTRSLGDLLFGLEGSGDSETRRLAIRVISDTGQPGDAEFVEVQKPTRPGHYGYLLGGVYTVDGTHPNFTAGDGFEFGVGYGSRLKPLPKWDSMTDAEFDAVERIAPYFTNGIVSMGSLAAPIDLGAVHDFILEISDECHRATRYGAWDEETLQALGSGGVTSPTDVSRVRRGVEDPSWTWREIFMDGTPRRPIRPENARWQYAVGTASPLTTWVDYVPGALLRGRYIAVRLLAREPLGLHQLQTGDVRVYARIPITFETIGSAGTPAVARAPGSRVRMLDGKEWVKGSGITSSGWFQLNEWAAWKEPARLTSTAALPAYTRTGNVIEANAVGALPNQDGQTLGAGQRFLLRHGASNVDNGVYRLTNPGGAGAKFKFERDYDFDEDNDVRTNVVVPVAEGTVNGGKAFRLTSTGVLTVNASNLVFAEFPTPGAGSGDMTKAVYDVDNDGVVDDSEALSGATLDTDGTLAADSDAKVPSQKAVKTYVDAKFSAVPVIVPFRFRRASPGPSVTALPLLSDDGSNANHPPLFLPGKIIGFGFRLSGSHSAGTATIRARVNSTGVTGIELSVAATDVEGYVAADYSSGDSLAQGDDLGCEIDTDGSWDGGGLLTVTVWLLLTP